MPATGAELVPSPPPTPPLLLLLPVAAAALATAGAWPGWLEEDGCCAFWLCDRKATLAGLSSTCDGPTAMAAPMAWVCGQWCVG